MTLFEETYDNILEDIFVLTKRRDLSHETELALRTATLSVHSMGAYPRDLCTELIQLVNPTYAMSINISETLPRFRGVATLQIVDVNYAPLTTPVIEVLEFGDIRIPGYNQLKTNVAYVAGNALNVTSNTPFYGVLVEFFQLPNVRRGSYDSWAAQLFPAIISHTAAIQVWGASGNEEKAAAAQKYITNILKPQFDSNFLTSMMR
jgi:hypothetical protein